MSDHDEDIIFSALRQEANEMSELRTLCEDQQAQIKRLKAVMMAIRDYDNVLDPSAAGLIDWLESVSPYEDVISELEATNP